MEILKKHQKLVEKIIQLLANKIKSSPSKDENRIKKRGNRKNRN